MATLTQVSSVPDDNSHLRIHSNYEHTEKGQLTVPKDVQLNQQSSVDVYSDKEPPVKESETMSTMEDKQIGLMNAKAMFILSLWYFFSFVTLFLNKYILATIKTDAVFFATVQMSITTLMGWVNIQYPCGMYQPVKREGGRPPNFYRNMLIVGSTRFLVVFLGLIALKFVPVSFTETVKSSAPLFTVFISRVMLGEINGVYVQCSLIPIMTGLALCSAYEMSFNIQGFLAALGTNISECLQFVCSKLCISGDKYKITPAEFQFYTCLASLVLQIPICFILMDINVVLETTTLNVIVMMLINGISYHYQTMMAWVLMSYVSPVTHSVCNTVKRAILIWASVLVFGNPITFLSGLGTCIVTAGVFVYNKARAYEQYRRDISVKYGHDLPHKDTSIRQL